VALGPSHETVLVVRLFIIFTLMASPPISFFGW
jgi:hypothetical protein